MGRSSRAVARSGVAAADQLATIISRADEMLRAARIKLSKWHNGLGHHRRAVATETIKEPAKPIITLPESAEVVIVGGGVAGCNALYELSKRGIQAVLLERSKLTSGTTWHTSGAAWSLRPSETDIELLQATRDTMAELEREIGENAGWINNGGLFIAHNEARMQEYRRLVDMGKVFGIPSKLLNAREAKEIFPLLDDKAFVGGIHSPEDGIIDPAMMVAALTKCSKRHGAKVFEDCPVTRILTDEKTFGSKQITGVETDYGVIRTNCVLNAGGAWSRYISRKVGLDIPLTPMKHAYVVTDSIPGVRNMPNVRDHDYSVCFKVQGESLSIGGYELNPIILRSVPKDFTFGLYELDWNVFGVHMESIMTLVPEIAKTGIKSTVCGPESFTPDHRPIMGEDPRCDGFFYSCGYNSAGMMYAGGCAKRIAEWIQHGRPDKHMFGYDIRRLTPPVILIMVLTMVVDIGSGPRWDWTKNIFTTSCTTKWWSILLYFQNFFEKDNYCLYHLWTLSVDMQLYWLSPFILYPLYKRPKFGLTLLLILIFASIFASGAIVGTNEYSALYFPHDFNTTKYMETNENLYTMTHVRASSWLIGVLLAYMIACETTTPTKVFISTGWILASASFAFCIFGTRYLTHINYEYNLVPEIIFATLQRPLWTFGICWIIYASIHNSAGPISNLLSAKIFLPISRLSYSIYMVHAVFLGVEIGILRAPKYFKQYFIIQSFITNTLISIVLALTLNIVVEVPILILEDIITKRMQIIRRETQETK